MILGTRRSIALTCILLAHGFLSIGLAQNADVPPINKSDFVVRSGCDGASCHKSAVIATPIWSNAVHIWTDHDPHANSYKSLKANSLSIVQRLWTGNGIPSGIEDPNYLSFLENNCISCHASEFAPVTQRQEGVDCQSCHGSATVWDPSHYSKEVKDLGDKRFQHPTALHRLDMESAWVAARVCGSCHIGELGRAGQMEFDDGSATPIGQREVSHKLMAAGHPPTYFELSHFLNKYPKHWWDRDNVAAAQASINQDEQKLSPANSRSLDTWRIGKLVNAKQRLELLRNRIGKSEWPEFTEHRCSSCHHPIDSRIQASNNSDLAFAQWDAWYLEQVDLALAITQLPKPNRASVQEPSATALNAFDHEIIRAWNEHRSKLEELLLSPLAVLHEAELQKSLSESCTTLINLLDKIIEKEYPLVTEDDIRAIKVSWAIRIKDFQVPTSWEPAVQLKLAAQALIYHASTDGPYPPFPLSDWDLSIDMWKRKQAIPYEASSDFKWNEFNQQLRELINSLE